MAHKVRYGAIGFLLIALFLLGLGSASDVCPCDQTIISNCDFENAGGAIPQWSTSQILITNYVGVTSSWWGNNPWAAENQGWWNDASASQTITIPENAEKLRWNVGTALWYSTDGITPTPGGDSYNVRLSVLIDGVYLADHYDPPVNGGTMEWDITPYRGKTVTLTLIIEGDGNEWANAWSQWVDITVSEPPGDNIITPAEMPYIIDDEEVQKYGHYFVISDDWTASSTDMFAILITAPDVTLDGGGHLLTGTLDSDSATYQNAIQVTSNNVNVQNTQVTGWDNGIQLYQVTTGHITGNVVTGNTMNGISLDQCEAITIEDNTANDNMGSEYSTGIMVSNSGNIDTRENSATGNRGGIFYSSVTGGNIVSNDVSGNSLNGIGVNMASSGITIEGNTVLICPFSDGQTSNGIYVGGEDLRVIDTINNQISDCSGTGIVYVHVTTGHITGNVVTGNTVNGIALDNCDAVTVEGNTVTDNTGTEYSWGIGVSNSRNIDTRENIATGNRAGIFYSSVTGGNIVSNDVSRNSLTGIGVNMASSGITVEGNTANDVAGGETSNGIYVGGEELEVIDIINNQVSGCSGTGIQYNAVTTGHIIGNVVTGNTVNGINLDNCDAVTVEGNTVTDNTGTEYSWGIGVSDSSNIDTRENIATGNRAGIFYSSVTGGNIVSNDVSRNSLTGIGVNRASSSITVDGNTANDVAGGETSNGIYVGGEELEVIDIINNQISGCSGTGIQYNAVTTGHITGNVVTGNAMNGINLDNCDAVTIEGNSVTDNIASEYSTGIMITNSLNIDTRENIATGNRGGIVYSNVIGGNVVSNDVSRNSLAGIAVFTKSSSITVEGNTANDVVGSLDTNAIFVGGEENLGVIDVLNNQVSGCSGKGIQFDHVTTGHINGNVVTGNTLNGINLDNCNAVTVEGNTVTDHTGSEYSTGIAVFNSLNIDTKENIATGNRAGIFYGSVTGGNIVGNDASNSELLGIGLTTGSTSITVEGNTVNAIIGGETSNGIQIGGENLEVIDVLNNQVSGCSGSGIQFDHVTTGHITGNVVTGNAMNGINLDACDAVTIEGNTVTDHIGSEYSTGITVFNSLNIDTKENTATGNRAGIFYGSVTGGNIVGNDASNSELLGIGLTTGSSSITIEGNTVNTVIGGETSNGIQIGGENLEVIDVLNNQVSGCSGSGIQFDHVTTGHITGNVVTGNAMNGINLDACDAVTIEGNTADDNNLGLFIGNSNEIIVKSNILQDNEYGFALSDSSNNQVFDNNFNNIVNVIIEGDSVDNSWNCEKTNQENIMGGPYLGGNFWATPQNDGFSEITPDFDGDGICEGEFVINDQNVDLLPLKGALPTAQFTSDIISGSAPLTVVFYDASTGPGISSWNWEFSDGTPAVPDQNPVHIFTEAGDYTITLTVQSPYGADSESKDHYITVLPANQPPVISPVGDRSVDEMETLEFTVEASDPDNDPLIYTASPLPTGATFTGTTFAWTPGYDQSGTYTVTFTVSDGELTAIEPVTITVIDIPPETAIENLITDIEDYSLPNNTENSLITKLDAALASLEKDNTDAAINQLNAFINAVNAQRGKKLTNEEADALILSAQAIISII